MTLPSWTVDPYTLLTLGNIEAEFGGNAPTNFSEYYAGAPSGYVTDDRVGYPQGIETPIPKDGNLAISNFYGSSSIPYTIVTDKSIYNEGDQILFTITSQDLDDTVMYWTIEDATLSITVDPPTLPIGKRNLTYAPQQLTANGGQQPYFYTITYGLMPAGLTLSPTGVISGTPTSVGTSTFTVTATDSNFNSGNNTYSITIAEVVIVISPDIMPTSIINQSYTATLSATGGQAPYTFSKWSGNLPTGVTLDNGVISGTPTALGNYNFVIVATDANSNLGYRSYNISVEAIEITFSPDTVPTALQRITYEGATISATNGTPPYIFSLASGSLPAGINLNYTTGVLSGTPTDVGQFLFTVRATDSVRNVGQKQYLLSVSTVELALNPPSLPTGYKNVPYNVNLIATGGQAPYTLSKVSGDFPAGLQLTGNTISGTPTTIQSSSFVIKLTDNLGNTTQKTFTVGIQDVVVSISPTTLPRIIRNQLVSIQLSASGGQGPYDFGVVDLLPGGLALSPSGLLSGNPTEFGSRTFTVRATDSNNNSGIQTYSLTLLSDSWQISLRGHGAAPAFVNEGAQLVFDVAAPATLTSNVTAYLAIISSGTSKDLAQDFYIPSTLIDVRDNVGQANVSIIKDYLTEGTEYFTINLEYPRGTVVTTYGNINVNDTSVTPTGGYGGELTISPDDIDAGTAYRPFGFTMSVSGGNDPYTWVQVSGTLPAGLVFYTGNSTVTGTPTTPVTNRAVVFRVRDLQGKTGYRTYTFNINPPVITISPESIDAQVVGIPYSITFSATGGTAPYTFTRTSGNLAAGSALTGNVLTGIPISKDPAVFTITARDSNNFTGNQEYTQTFNSAPLDIRPAIIAPLWKFNSYSQQLTVAGGTPPYIFNADPSKPLPDGLSISNTGLINGIPSVDGSYSFKVNVVDKYGDTAETTYDGDIKSFIIGNPDEAPENRVKKLFGNVTLGFPFSTTIPVTGGAAPYSFSLAYGTMPGWIITQTTPNVAVVSGTTTGSGFYTFSIKVTDSLNRIGFISPTVYVFPLIKPVWDPIIYYPGDFPNHGYENDNYVSYFPKLEFTSSGIWNLYYYVRYTNAKRIIQSGRWYNGQIAPASDDGNQLSIIVNSTNYDTFTGTRETNYITTLPTDEFNTPDNTDPSPWLVVYPMVRDGYGLLQEYTANIRIFWKNRQYSYEEHLVTIKFRNTTIWS